MKIKNIILTLFSFFAFVFLNSCKSPSDVIYLQNLENGQKINTLDAEFIKIAVGDKLSIIVTSRNLELSNIFNNSFHIKRIGEVSSVSSRSETSTYLVDKDGELDFPVFGKIHVAGLSKKELEEYLKEKIISGNYVLDPIVTVEFGNIDFSILGEVKSPGQYSLTRQRNTIFEALAQGMDLTIDGQRKDVLIIRENYEGNTSSYRVDLTDPRIMESPAYYINQNDIIYVTPNDQKRRESTVFGNTFQKPTFWLSVVSCLCAITLVFCR